ncbi:MAG: hypothetical protein ABH879_02895 [archaeon]
MSQNRSKIATKRIPVTLTLQQVREIRERVGSLGSNQSDVLKYIITNWLDSNGKTK